MGCCTRMWVASTRGWPLNVASSPDGLLQPFGTVDPLLPDWQKDFVGAMKCAACRHSPASELSRLSARQPRVCELLKLAAERGLVVRLALAWKTRACSIRYCAWRMWTSSRYPMLWLLCRSCNWCCSTRMPACRMTRSRVLVGTGRVCFEIATLEGVGGIAALLARVPLDQVLFGSHFPYFILESAVLKLRESALSPVQLNAITCENASRVLKTDSSTRGS